MPIDQQSLMAMQSVLKSTRVKKLKLRIADAIIVGNAETLNSTSR